MLAELGETRADGALWAACRHAAEAHVESPSRSPRPPVRHRDLLLAVTGADCDALVHPLLIRWCAAFLDQGVAYWPMPVRELGLYGAVCRLYGGAGRVVEPWLRPMRAALARDADALGVVLESLAELGVDEGEWEPFLAATLLALRGWAGMIQQVEARPDRVPVAAPPARLIDFLALRLLSERFALAYLARETFAWSAPLAGLRPALRKATPAPTPRTASERAWLLFEKAPTSTAGLRSAGRPARSPGPGALVDELDRLPGGRAAPALAPRLRAAALSPGARRAAADAGEPAPSAAAPPLRFQSIFCIDEREESLRRHLEEVEPRRDVGAAGFFGVAMYYRGVDDAQRSALSDRRSAPRHEVEEVELASLREGHQRLPRAAALGSAG